MNELSKFTLREMENNKALSLNIKEQDYDDERKDYTFNSSDGSDFSKLGTAIGNSTYLKYLEIKFSDKELALNSSNTEFFNGLKRNTSIDTLRFECCTHYLQAQYSNIREGRRRKVSDGVIFKMLILYQEKNTLTSLSLHYADLRDGGDRILADTFRSCTNLKHISLQSCNMYSENLIPMVDALRGQYSLKRLDLGSNGIGNAGCEALATLLDDPNTKIRHLNMFGNSINDVGVIAITNVLVRNKQLQELILNDNEFDYIRMKDVFLRLLCNTASINDIYSSNHTLQEVGLNRMDLGPSLELNKGSTNQSSAAMKKTLQMGHIDMEPLFVWDADGEQTLKSLPYAVAWFDRAGRAVVADMLAERNRNRRLVSYGYDTDVESEHESDLDEDDIAKEKDKYNIDKRKLSAIYQFALVMPTLFISKGIEKKRKRRPC